MAEEITTQTASETQTATVATEENTTVSQEPQVTAPENIEANPVENSNNEQAQEGNQEDSTTQQPTVEELQAKGNLSLVEKEELNKLKEAEQSLKMQKEIAEVSDDHARRT